MGAKKIDKKDIPATPHLGIQQVMAQVKCSLRHIHGEIKRGNLQAFKPGKELIFFQEDIDKWIRRKKV